MANINPFLKSPLFLLIINGLTVISLYADPGDKQAAIETLVLPYGSRENAMGDVGVTISRGEAATYYNPALLGVDDSRLQYGDFSYQFEKPYPHSLYNKNRHHSISFCYQPPGNYFGGFGLNVNHYQKGDIGEISSGTDASESIYGLSWGFGFQDLGLKNHTWGVTFKYIHSDLFPGCAANSFAFDLGYNWKISRMFSFGLDLMNMGPAVYYFDRTNSDPIPCKINLGIGFEKKIFFCGKPLDIQAEYKISRYFVQNYYDGRPPDPFYMAIVSSCKGNSALENRRSILQNFGYELTFLNSFHLRQGFFIDNRYNENEMHWGFGGTLFGSHSLDFYHIYSPRTTPYRNATFGITATACNLWKGKKGGAKLAKTQSP